MTGVLIAHSFFLRRDPKQYERCKPYPPLSTLLGAAILREARHDIAFFDATFADSANAFEAALDQHRPTVVLLLEDNFNFLTKMCTMNRREDALAMVAAARRRGCRVAVNGPDSNDHAALYLGAGADAVLVGEGEFGVSDLVDAFAGNAPIDRVAGLLIRGATGGVRPTVARQTPSDLGRTLLPAWDLVDATAYRDAWHHAHGHFSWHLGTSRGCPYRCNWCAKPTFGRRYSQRPPASVAEEMALIKDTVRPDHIWFSDDIFGMTAEWIEEFARQVANRDAAIPFTIQSRCNLIHERSAAALQVAGCVEVWMGIESGSQKILDAMDKGTQVEGAGRATRLLRENGIRSGWFLQLGYPTEQWEDILMTRDLVRREAPDEIGVSVAYPLPGTVFHDRVAAQLGKHRNWRDTNELAMLFQGTFDTQFYRLVRDLLHDEVSTRNHDDERWIALERRAASCRSPRPVDIALSA